MPFLFNEILHIWRKRSRIEPWYFSNSSILIWRSACYNYSSVLNVSSWYLHFQYFTSLDNIYGISNYSVLAIYEVSEVWGLACSGHISLISTLGSKQIWTMPKQLKVSWILLICIYKLVAFDQYHLVFSMLHLNQWKMRFIEFPNRTSYTGWQKRLSCKLTSCFSPMFNTIHIYMRCPFLSLLWNYCYFSDIAFN